MSDSPTPETDKKQNWNWDRPDNVEWKMIVPSRFARRLERDRDEAREELARVRKELVASNRGAETNAKVNQGLCARLAEAERERDEASSVRDEALKEWDESMEVLDKALEDRNELRKKLDDSDVVITRLITERTQAREVAKLAFYIIRGVDPKFVKLAYERSVYWNGQDQPIQFMRDAIKKWDKEQKEEAK